MLIARNARQIIGLPPRKACLIPDDFRAAWERGGWTVDELPPDLLAALAAAGIGEPHTSVDVEPPAEVTALRARVAADAARIAQLEAELTEAYEYIWQRDHGPSL